MKVVSSSKELEFKGHLANGDLLVARCNSIDNSAPAEIECSAFMDSDPNKCYFSIKLHKDNGTIHLAIPHNFPDLHLVIDEVTELLNPIFNNFEMYNN